MGVYAFGTTAGFMIGFKILIDIIKKDPDEWRPAWTGIGLAVSSSSSGISGAQLSGAQSHARNRYHIRNGIHTSKLFETSFTVRQALTSPAFWTFTIGISFYGLVVAGTSLFNESILAERGFDKRIFGNVAQIGIPMGLAANLLVGWLATRLFAWRSLWGLATGLFALEPCSAFPLVTTGDASLRLCVDAGSGGWRHDRLFLCGLSPGIWLPTAGLDSECRATVVTVLFSAVGPLIFASTKVRFGSYTRRFFLRLQAVIVAWFWLNSLGSSACPDAKCRRRSFRPSSRP